MSQVLLLFLGSTGCQPVAFGRRAECTFAQRAKPVCVPWIAMEQNRFAASCRELQASGLCSPETKN